MNKISYQIYSVILLTVAILTGIFYFSYNQLQNKIIDSQLTQIKFLLRTIGAGEKRLLIDEIFDNRYEALKLHAETLLKIDGVTNINAYTAKQQSLFNSALQLDIPPGTDFDENDVCYILKTHSVTMYYRLAAAGEIVGYLQIDYSLKELQENKAGMTLIFWLFLSTLIATLLIVLYISLFKIVIKPVKKLTKMVQQIFYTNDYSAIDMAKFPVKNAEISNYFTENPSLNEMEILETSFLHLILKQKEFTENLQGMVEKRTAELLDAMKNISDLKNMLPICSGCKKIRDDHGYWHQVETYISKHSNIDFSHSLCPDCVKKLYPQYTPKPADKKPDNS